MSNNDKLGTFADIAARLLLGAILGAAVCPVPLAGVMFVTGAILIWVGLREIVRDRRERR